MAVIVASNLLGNSLGFLLPSFFISDEEEDFTKVRHQFLVVVMIEAGLAFLATALIGLLWRERPPTPVSVESALQDDPLCSSLT